MNRSTKGEKTKEQLIECAARLFLIKGYTATGINEILSTAGLSKGSFYFYFSSKKDLVIAVVEHFNQIRLKELSSAAQNRTWEDFIEKVVGDKIKEAKENNTYGCPFAVLGMETAFAEPDIAVKSYESIKQAIQIFKEVLIRSGTSDEKAVVGAERAFAIYEGYLLFYRLSKDLCELEKIQRDLIDLNN
jgi:AcrR family transcriptional regulator